MMLALAGGMAALIAYVVLRRVWTSEPVYRDYGLSTESLPMPSHPEAWRSNGHG